MKTNLCFFRNANVVRATEVASAALQDSFPEQRTIGFDSDTGDVLCFFPIDFLDHFSDRLREKQLKTLKEAWHDAYFEILEEREMYFSEYVHVPYCSLFFRLKSLG